MASSQTYQSKTTWYNTGFHLDPACLVDRVIVTTKITRDRQTVSTHLETARLGVTHQTAAKKQIINSVEQVAEADAKVQELICISGCMVAHTLSHPLLVL